MGLMTSVAHMGFSWQDTSCFENLYLVKENIWHNFCLENVRIQERLKKKKE